MRRWISRRVESKMTDTNTHTLSLTNTLFNFRTKMSAKEEWKNCTNLLTWLYFRPTKKKTLRHIFSQPNYVAELKTLLSMKSSGHSRGNGHKIIIFVKVLLRQAKKKNTTYTQYYNTSKTRICYTPTRFAKPRDFVAIPIQNNSDCCLRCYHYYHFYACALGNGGWNLFKSNVFKRRAYAIWKR